MQSCQKHIYFQNIIIFWLHQVFLLGASLINLSYLSIFGALIVLNAEPLTKTVPFSPQYWGGSFSIYLFYMANCISILLSINFNYPVKVKLFFKCTSIEHQLSISAWKQRRWAYILQYEYFCLNFILGLHIIFNVNYEYQVENYIFKLVNSDIILILFIVLKIVQFQIEANYDNANILTDNIYLTDTYMIKDLSYSNIIKTLKNVESAQDNNILKKCKFYHHFIEDNESGSFIKRLNFSQLDNVDKKSRSSLEKSIISDPITLIRNKQNFNVQQKQLQNILAINQTPLTLKQRIQAKLMARKNKKNQHINVKQTKQLKSKKKNNRQNFMFTNIKETTFRPNILKTQLFQEDDMQTCRVLSPYQIMKTKRNEKITDTSKLLTNSVHLCQNYIKSPHKQQNKKQTKSKYEKTLKLTEMTFEQRQNRLLENKQAKIEREKQVKCKQQIKGCTFKPKLTTYRCHSLKKTKQ